MRHAAIAALLSLLWGLQACSTCTSQLRAAEDLLERCDAPGAAAALSAAQPTCGDQEEFRQLTGRLQRRDREAGKRHERAALDFLGDGREGEAQAEARKACALDHSSDAAKRVLAGEPAVRQSALRLRKGSALVDRCDAADAARALEEALRLWPGNEPARDLLARLGKHDSEAAKERVKAVIALLDRGREPEAKDELARVCRLDPGNEDARKFIAQIEQVPDAFFNARFGEKRFPYAVQPGDTLSKIAGRFLKDEYLFYALARSNGIRAPSSLEVGQTIRVPGAPPPAAPERDLAPPSVSADPPGGRHTTRASVTLRARDDADPNPKIWYTVDGSLPAPGRGIAYVKPIELSAPTTLRFLAVDASGNTSKSVQEVYAFDAPCTEDFYRKALESWRRQDAEATIAHCNKALTCDPSNHAAGNLRVQAVEALVNLCRIGYQKKNCDEALFQCDKALKYDPDNRRALELRKQTLECKKR